MVLADDQALYALGNSLLEQGQTQAAIDTYLKIITGQGHYMEVYQNLGNAYYQEGQLEAAIHSYREALRLKPDAVPVLNNLGHVFLLQGDWNAALPYFEAAAQFNPDDAEVHYYVAYVFHCMGNHAAALENYEKALLLQPDMPGALNNMGGLLKEQGRIDEAMVYFEKAIVANPECSSPYVNLANEWVVRMRMDKALACYQKLSELHPEKAILKLQQNILCAPLVDSIEAIAQIEKQIEDSLVAMAEEAMSIEFDDLFSLECYRPPFYLTYYGQNDLEIRSRFADLLMNNFSFETYAVPVKEKITGKRHRIGFLVTQNHERAFCHLLGGILNHLSTEKFELTVVCSQSGMSYLQSHLDMTRLSLFPMAPQWNQAISDIQAQAFDLMYFAEVGTDLQNYILPFFNLARVQCASYMFPVTTGIPTVDYFVSSALWETGDADTQYREKLVRLETLPIYFYHPKHVVGKKTRADFGFPEDAHLYSCPQTLYKIHPAFDSILADILDADPLGLLVLLQSGFAEQDAFLMKRLQKHIPNADTRICMLPKQSTSDFMDLLSLSDVMLDPIHYGGGITTYEALALGTPVVTLPSEFLRGRISCGIYKKMGMTDCIVSTPETYAATAIKLGTDPDYRESIRSRILSANHELYEDMGAVEAFEAFLTSAL